MKRKLIFSLILVLFANASDTCFVMPSALIILKEQEHVREIVSKFNYIKYLYDNLLEEERVILSRNGISYDNEIECFRVENPQILQPFSRL